MGFSCLRFLSRLFRAGLGIVPFRRTLRHLRPYTFKQASWPIDAVPQTLTPHATPALHLLVRTPEQLKAALAVRPASITLDYLDLYGLKPSLEGVRAAGIAARVASPRVLKPGEERIVDFLLSCECPLLVRSAGLLHQLREKPHAELVGDFSLNAANTITAAEFLSMGLRSLTPAHDLNAAQVAELARGVGGDRVEAILYQHLPVFHTEHCVFCRFLSTGTSYRDCGRPCESHTVELRSEEHTSELQSLRHLVCRLLLEKK